MDIKDLPWQPTTTGLILDPYAGRRKWWKGLPTRRVVFVDKYATGERGTIKADICQLPFRDMVFTEIWADPPHFIRRSKFSPSCRLGHFGQYPTRNTVVEEWETAAKSLWRVTIEGAKLVWKIIDGAKTANQCVCRADASVLDSLWPLIDELERPSRVAWSTAKTVYQLRTRKS